MRRRLRLAGLISLLLHAALLGGAWLWARRPLAPPPVPDVPGAVELVMIEQKGAGETTTPPSKQPPTPAQPQPTEQAQAQSQPAQATQAAPPAAAAQNSPARPPAPVPQANQAAQPTPPQTDKAEAKPPASPPAPPTPEPPPTMAAAPSPPRPVQPQAEALPPKQPDAPPQPDMNPPAEPPAQRVEQPPPTRAAAEAPVAAPAKPAEAAATKPPPPPATTDDSEPRSGALAFSLAGTGSDSTALAVGNAIIPASPDKAFRNRPPVYPEAAAVLGQHGTVWVMIHVSPQGLPVGADIVQSSGHPLLDRAARDAVMRWHFLPAVKDGQPIPFDMPMRFLFEID